MKRKIISIILAALMVVGMIPFAAVPAFAGEQEPEYLSETIVFNNSLTAESEHFTLTALDYDEDGWYGGDSDVITITPKNNEKLFIRNIEAVIGESGFSYVHTGISSGTKREPGNMNNGVIVHIDGVDDYSFSFIGGNDYTQFKDITILYEIHTHTPTLISEKEGTETEHGYTTSFYYCEDCGLSFSDAECTNKILKATADSYIIHNWSEKWMQGDANGHIYTCTCTGCSAVQTQAHMRSVGDTVCNVCGYSGVFAETIFFNNNTTAESEHFTLTASDYDKDGWSGRFDGTFITITPKNNEKLYIRNAEAIIGVLARNYAHIGVSSGTKRETGNVYEGSRIHIDDVDDFSLSFVAYDDYNLYLKDITVFYEVHTHTTSLIPAKEATETEHGVSTDYYYCESCGKFFSDSAGENILTEADIAESYTIHHLSEIPAKEATETEHGISNAYYRCNICEKLFSDAECTNEITKATVDSYSVHNWAVVSADAKGHNCTCTVPGCGAQSTAHTEYIDDGVCDVCGYSGFFAETIVFNNSTTAESEHFTLTAGRADEDGWYGGGEWEYITVTPKNNENLIIKNIETVVGSMGVVYSEVAISGGKKRETGNVSDGTTVHIDRVYAKSFSFATRGRSYAQFKDITVYFCASHTYEEILGAKAAIDAAAGANPGKSVKRIADGAKTDIDSAMTVAEIMAIRDECISDIEKLTHNHTFSTEWSFDETKHWHAPTCGHNDAISEFADHTFGTDGKCTVCGYEKQAGEKKYTVVLTGISNPDKNYSGATDDSGICNIENIENGTYLMAISCEGAVTRTYKTEITDSTIRQDIELYDNGDVNGDGEITVEDYSAAVNAALAGDNEVPEDLSLDADYSKAVADIDCDGVVDVLDIAMLERKIFA